MLTAHAADFQCSSFVKVSEIREDLRSFKPDFVFAVGLSQILTEDILNIAKFGNIGFHPTALPKGRGRAAIAWLVMVRNHGAATFFEIKKGIDDGPILVQKHFTINDEDDASNVEEKLLVAEALALDEWLPNLIAAPLQGIPQDHNQATWFGRRTPEDGLIDWNGSDKEILRLIRASAPPHPGAFTYFNDVKVRILQAKISNHLELGVIGRILKTYEDNSFLIQTGTAPMLVQDWDCDKTFEPKVGVHLGYKPEAEIHSLRQRVNKLEDLMSDLLSSK